ncbi:Flagellum-specific peptidoglycan hydrolase FlgJ [Peptoclostridium litorale DSM 5388]|uniref:Exo-glucosaminidase LytG n=1 Tax=Peptoclostridium litorale DSM 5388 TaxID=1121324 RepID=A0A069RL07_PEPLI|nr:glycoside hydrolase family 73 protein [Peptoclostridium litorale]KDR96800.1 Exo-glucosaminidase LytG [Peptoclostridium litorale DSM 5388]SIO36282.1 Flagellum-specific peptidoglycan hydrolase FlgJ [Peptoclostridium litorale DSM 5388]
MEDTEKKTFIKSILGGALDGQKKYGLLPSVTIAQAILESGWGKHAIGFNLFGIKASRSWKGRTVSAKTYECRNSEIIQTTAIFRDYGSFNESVMDHNRLIGESKRYSSVIKANSYRAAAKALQSCGYATDPDYPAKLISIIESNHLDQYDRQLPDPAQVSPYAASARKWAMDKGISDGSRPKELATREEVWTMLYRNDVK